MPMALAVHGGAWNIPHRLAPAHAEGISRALDAVWKVMRAGAPALDAVELAVRILEDDPTFNAGRGSRLNRAGRVEMDASIMEGTRLTAGAVAGVDGVRHPVSLARKVMERSPHVLLVGQGARRFARLVGAERCTTPSLLVGRELERYRRVRKGDRRPVRLEFRDRPEPDSPMGTVGAVALDREGRVAAATSTGGTQDKWPGRVGDSGVIGAGTWADDRIGAVSCTGWGEGILRVVLAKRAADCMEAGQRPSHAARKALAAIRRIRGRAGVILVDRHGRVGTAFNTPRMARGFVIEGRGSRVMVDRLAVRR